MNNDAELPEVEPYPGELPAIKRAFERLSREFANTPMTSSAQRLFDMTASNLFGEAGFNINVTWRELASTDGESLSVHQPLVTLTGRVKKEEETDHSRIQWEVQNGLLDGKKGVIRPDGSFREDSARKNIY